MNNKANKNEIVKKITELTDQKSQIEQELLSLQKQCAEVLKNEYEQYIGKCYKQDIEDENDFETVYYKVLDFYDNDDINSTYFWVLVVEEHFENLDKPTLYIHKECADLLGHKKYFLRQLIPISNKEFRESFDNVCENIIDINNI